MFKHILVPTDGSEFSTETVKRAVSFAKEAGAEITAFYAKPDLSSSAVYGESAIVLAKALEEENARSEAYAQTVLAFVEGLCRDAGVKCHTLTKVSVPIYEGIIDAATQCGCDLIFMASHGRSGIKALLLGSETNKVLTHSTIPVLVYR